MCSPIAQVSLRDLRFSHDVISPKWRRGTPHEGFSLESLVKDLDAGHINPFRASFLKLAVSTFDGADVSMNNRRLWAMQQHQLHMVEAMRMGQPFCAHVLTDCPG
mmetsp:Transcript_19382/g.50887  ORF Transcript_19382/g.50887 Transcript_19382/m.50887 type:complete len:105 (+) Transcript_19382:252-566(+)